MNTKKEESHFLDIIKMIGIFVFVLTLCLLSWVPIYYVGNKILNFATPYANAFLDRDKKIENVEMVKIQTLDCNLTCLDGTTESRSGNWLYSDKKDCYIPSLNPIVIKIDYNNRKVNYISTSDSWISIEEFGNKIDFTTNNFRHQLLENGSFASFKYYNERWNQLNKGICRPRIG